MRLEGEKVTASLKSVSEPEQVLGAGFLDFFSRVQEGESSSEGKLIEEHVDFKDSSRVKTEAYYCTKHGKVKGVLTVRDAIILFDPLLCKENEPYRKWDLNSKFQACIDLKDVVSVQILKLPNETAQFVEEETDRIRYIYDFYIELVVASTNGRTSLTKTLAPKAEAPPVLNEEGLEGDSPEAAERRKTEFAKHLEYCERLLARKKKDWDRIKVRIEDRAKYSVAMRFSHRDRVGHALKTHEQLQIVETISKLININLSELRKGEDLVRDKLKAEIAALEQRMAELSPDNLEFLEHNDDLRTAPAKSAEVSPA